MQEARVCVSELVRKWQKAAAPSDRLSECYRIVRLFGREQVCALPVDGQSVVAYASVSRSAALIQLLKKDSCAVNRRTDRSSIDRQPPVPAAAVAAPQRIDLSSMERA